MVEKYCYVPYLVVSVNSTVLEHHATARWHSFAAFFMLSEAGHRQTSCSMVEITVFVLFFFFLISSVPSIANTISSRCNRQRLTRLASSWLDLSSLTWSFLNPLSFLGRLVNDYWYCLHLLDLFFQLTWSGLIIPWLTWSFLQSLDLFFTSLAWSLIFLQLIFSFQGWCAVHPGDYTHKELLYVEDNIVCFI